MSAAKPKIADYPFTTLHPNLGVVRTPARDLVLADIPGLIEGANEGAGLGTRFLGHIERCRVLLHLVDATGEDLGGAYRTVRAELRAYGGGLEKKKEIVALSKCDALDEATLAAKAAELKAAARKKPMLLSAASGRGVKEALAALAREIGRPRARTREAAGDVERAPAVAAVIKPRPRASILAAARTEVQPVMKAMWQGEVIAAERPNPRGRAATRISRARRCAWICCARRPRPRATSSARTAFSSTTSPRTAARSPRAAWSYEAPSPP